MFNEKIDEIIQIMPLSEDTTVFIQIFFIEMNAI